MKTQNQYNIYFLSGCILGLTAFPSSVQICLRHFLQTGTLNNLNFSNNNEIVPVNYADLLGGCTLLILTATVLIMLIIWIIIDDFYQNRNTKQSK